jgi:hypothetical protein
MIQPTTKHIPTITGTMKFVKNDRSTRSPPKIL